MTKLKNILAAVFALVIFADISNAQTVNTSYPVNGGEPLQVKYLGDDGEYLLFNVVLQSTDSKRALLAIEDKSIGEIYSSGMRADLKTVTVKIERKEGDGQVLNFRLVLGKETFTKSFSVNTNTVETTTVSENDITKL